MTGQRYKNRSTVRQRSNTLQASWPTPSYYTPYSRAIFEDPYPLYRRLRDEAPAYPDPDGRWWVLSRFDDVWEALRDWQTFSSDRGPGTGEPRPRW